MEVNLNNVNVISGENGIRMIADVTNNSYLEITCDVVFAVLYPSTGAIELIATKPTTLSGSQTKTVTHTFSASEVEQYLDPGLHDAYAVVEYGESRLDEKLLPGEINVIMKGELPWWLLLIPVAVGGGYLIKRWQSHR